ncbi:LysR family transcriptional regulator [Alteromonas halophila]|uniref:LysR family transcriptional regulator n=1 Tax=Alteromonas halophila TaxID=516698 RepID=A0A918JHX2_9ALTE|nr:LysR family transcriptional regulator [Alteromonas halophila]GGW81544.1 LysR family transcriptional regulator [Alteromonas halophila]
MRLRHIEIFHAIYTTGSITNAAELLRVSQPSVSKVLSHAEMQLGFQLFDRVKGRLIPTSEAEMLFDEVDKIYQQIRSINNTARNIKRSSKGTIRMGVTPALGFEAVPEAIADFHRDYPNVSFEVKTMHNDEVMQSLIEHKCDFAMLYSPKEMPGVESSKCADSELVFMYNKHWFDEARTSLQMSDLEDKEFIDIADSGPLADMLWTRMMKEGVRFSSEVKVQTYFIAARMVAKGIGFCVVDRHTAESNLCGDVAIASFEPKLTFDVCLLHLANKGIPKVAEAFIPYLKDTIASDF